MYVQKEDQACQADIEIDKDEPQYRLIRQFEDLQDKYNKIVREQRVLNTVKESLEDSLKETFANLKDE